jgi:cell division protein FtsW
MLKHLLFILLGFVLIYFSHLLNYRYYAGISKVLMVITIPLLLYTLLFGSHVNDASRWIAIPGTGLTFQTSDLAKLALITFLARTLTKKQENIKDVKKAFIPIMGSVCLVFILIGLANLSTALMLFGVSILILLIGRISMKQIAIVCVGGAALLAVLVFFGPRRETYKSRIRAYTNPEMQNSDRTFQQDQAKIAIASGGILGKGPGNSTQRNFLPHPYSDFIFAIIGEELGLVGALVVILLFVFLAFSMLRIMQRTNDPFKRNVVQGVMLWIVFQALVNIAVVLRLLPVLGVPLPLISAGGSSLISALTAVGVVLAIERENHAQPRAARSNVQRGAKSPLRRKS